MFILKSVDYQVVLLSSALLSFKELFHLVKNKEVPFSSLSDWVKIVRNFCNSYN